MELSNTGSPLVRVLRAVGEIFDSGPRLTAVVVERVGHGVLSCEPYCVGDAEIRQRRARVENLRRRQLKIENVERETRFNAEIKIVITVGLMIPMWPKLVFCADEFFI